MSHLKILIINTKILFLKNNKLIFYKCNSVNFLTERPNNRFFMQILFQLRIGFEIEQQIVNKIAIINR